MRSRQLISQSRAWASQPARPIRRMSRSPTAGGSSRSQSSRSTKPNSSTTARKSDSPIPDSIPKPKPKPEAGEAGEAERVQRIINKLPAYLKTYATRFKVAPVQHLVTFLVLHEVTAIVPLVGLFGLFHYTNVAPIGKVMEYYGDYVREGVARAERYFTKKGWFGFGEGEGEEAGVMTADGGSWLPPINLEDSVEAQNDTVQSRWESADPKYKIAVEVALAYGLTKAMLPLRIMVSFWLTPGVVRLFAGRLEVVKRFFTGSPPR